MLLSLTTLTLLLGRRKGHPACKKRARQLKQSWADFHEIRGAGRLPMRDELIRSTNITQYQSVSVTLELPQLFATFVNLILWRIFSRAIFVQLCRN